MDKKKQKGETYEGRKICAYLSQIAETPLLTEDEEKEILADFLCPESSEHRGGR